MILSDSHMHTSFSTDSEAAPEAVIERAISLGLSSICFTDHMDFDYPGEGFLFDPDAYFEKLLPLRSLYRDRIRIRIGVEIGLQAHLNETIHRLIDAYPFDFVIGSMHLVGGQDPYYRDQIDAEDAQLYMRYFKETADCLRATDGYQALGHLDYVVRYGYEKEKEYQYPVYQDAIDEILKCLIEKNVALEVNTAGLKYGLSSPNPGKEVISRYLELGGEMITVGSDAHKPEYLAHRFDQLNGILKEAGVRFITEFTERKPVRIRLE